MLSPVNKVPKIMNLSMDQTTRILIAGDEKGPRDALQIVLGLFYLRKSPMSGSILSRGTLILTR